MEFVNNIDILSYLIELALIGQNGFFGNREESGWVVGVGEASAVVKELIAKQNIVLDTANESHADISK